MKTKNPSDVPRAVVEAIPRAAWVETYVSSYPLAPIAYHLTVQHRDVLYSTLNSAIAYIIVGNHLTECNAPIS